MKMLVDERKQVRALLIPVKTRTLARPSRSGRDCQMFVIGAGKIKLDADGRGEL